MENASNALIMAASILIGVLILSLGVYIFTTMGQYAAEADDRIAQTQVSMFNANFTKYIGEVTFELADGTIEKQPITCTMHDIITVANFAKQSNVEFGVEDVRGASDASNYVQVDLKAGLAGPKILNLEKKINDQYVSLLNTSEYMYINAGTPTSVQYELRQYQCELQYSNTTGRVNHVIFSSYP